MSSTLLESEQGSDSAIKPALDIADLFRELQETNRLLREIASQKAVDQDPTQPILSRVSKASESSRNSGNFIQPVHQVRVFLSSPDVPSRRANPSGRLLELQWEWRLSSRIHGLSLADGELENLRTQWLVEFDLDRLTERVSRHSGWILGKDTRRNGMLCACPLVYGPGEVLAPANSILDECHKAKALVSKMTYPELVSPGALWHFTTPIWANGVLPLSRLALIAAVCLVNPEEEFETAHDFLHVFCAPWKPLRFRGTGFSFNGWTGSNEISYQHTIRCFSNVMVDDQSDFAPYVRCHRESGQFPALPGAPSPLFTERRMSILCRWSELSGELSFTIVLLGDFQSLKQESQASNDLFTDWKDRHFTVKGKNAGYHMLQSAVHRMLMSWEKEWSQCLDRLGDTVNINLNDILSDETSNRLMFDTSYARSRVYFKTLEILRIFGDIIRETGRDLQEMDPERLLQGSFLRAGWDVRYFLREEPATDKALWKNWRILSEFQKGAEERLIRRINEKTEEIKSLRDGSIFGTPLFEAEEQAETVQRFKTSTIIVCVITYVLAFLLLWVADKWDTAGMAVPRDPPSFAASTWNRLKGGNREDTQTAPSAASPATNLSSHQRTPNE
ncbi:predicted protein [Chaetomium globosum CBS 148.51]|uniref:Uncharacterized protein n=1 Tax=Chaetomium globosum (strain ATCC 6205 / CBS 148.51 / DSM 1962 / NBRC 6347 / NRRL 1970) TaxID=306901 RepID=Q2GYM8_CHAGB|nr:uncharacterized protein CHGG_06926 [Chaetomium globosum CBS 148.51]EAQ85673.1 predicted protein [Chaetomium globosum CBS 148.51]